MSQGAAVCMAMDGTWARDSTGARDTRVLWGGRRRWKTSVVRTSTGARVGYSP